MASMRGNEEIADAGAMLGGFRRSGPATSGSEDDFVYRRWPRPDFAAAARSGRTTAERAALFMAIYANIAPRPALVAVPGGGAAGWPALWRASVDLLRAMWEEGFCQTAVEAVETHDRLMKEAFEGTPLERYAPFGTGRGRGEAVTHGLSLGQVNSVRARWLPRIGWPVDRRLRDDDVFGVVLTKKGTEVWHQPVKGSGSILQPIGKGDHFRTEVEAEAELRRVLEGILGERERDRALGVRAKALGAQGVRVGPENPRRAGRRATVEDMTSALGMRGVEFGQFLGQRERQEVLDQTFDAFFDLCTVLRVPAQGASLWGRAGIAFGSRGMGASVKGHFDPTHWVVHMDRSQGAGVLAHEMGHAIDAALAEASGLGRGALLSEGVAAGWNGHSIARLMADVDAESRKGENGRPSAFLLDARKLDDGRGAYWSNPAEMFARLFEAWVHDALAARGRRNDFLVSNSSGAEQLAGLEWRALTSPYPKGRERRRMVDIMGEFLRVAMPLAQDRLEGGAKRRRAG